ncbi:MAG: long-chain fatty acid--CoA ligase [Candidatus Omnitrophota bacterium]
MDTIISIVRQRIEAHPKKIALRYKRDRKFKGVSWGELGETITSLGCAFLDLGTRIGDRVAILSENRPEWAYTDLAILSCGAITVPIYPTSTTKEIEYILNDSGAETVFVSTKGNLDKVASIAGQTPLKRIITFQEAPSADPLVMLFDKFLEIGKNKLPLYRDPLGERGKAVTQEDLVSIIYTSGSTGAPKGVMLTNKNFVTNCKASADVVRIGPKDRYLSFLPLSHAFEKMAGFYMMLIQGAEITYAQSRETIFEDIKAVHPTMLCGVPRFFEKLYAEILNKVIAGPSLNKNLFFWAHKIGRACLKRRLKRKRVPLHLAVLKMFITKPISKKLKALLGGKLKFFISGGAPLSSEIAYFFLSFDILILEGYGLTESSTVISVNSPRDFKIGTVGKPLSGVEVKIAPDGEILARGPNIMKGYYKHVKDTETSLKDGWLYTGDIGHFDRDGFLVITDRKKDIIVTSGGKNISPSEIETAIKVDRYIDDVLVYGDRRKFISALIMPNVANLEKYARFKEIEYKNLEELVKNPKIQSFMERRIDAKQVDIPKYAQIKKCVILSEELKQSKGELTPTLKIKRKIVTEKYKKLLDSLYEENIS